MDESTSLTDIYNNHISNTLLTTDTTKIQLIIEIKSDRTIIRQTKSGMQAQSKQRSGGGRRGKVDEYTRDCRARFIEKARELSKLRFFVVLTYPRYETPENYDETRRHWTRMREWLRRQSVSGITMKEFHRNGSIHYNLLIEDEIDIDKAKKRWAAIVGASDPNHRIHGVWMRELKSKTEIDKVINYLAKFQQKTIPSGVSIGRFWTIIGTPEKYPVSIIIDTTDNLQGIAEKLRELEQEYCRRNNLAIHEYDSRHRNTLFHVHEQAAKLIEQVGSAGGGGAKEAQ
ncbi:MAG: hypothetical protein P4L33_02570 [Capsulimonadaceae bacterium]|nr:hypothetical protein [Capsulimonadaceae bacterium]